MGWVYTYHLHEPIGGPKANPDKPPKPTQRYWHTRARHYTGWALDLDERLAVEEGGGKDAARFMAYAVALGIQFDLVHVERGDRNRERQLKMKGAARRCVLCQAQRRLEAYESARLALAA